METKNMHMLVLALCLLVLGGMLTLGPAPRARAAPALLNPTEIINHTEPNGQQYCLGILGGVKTVGAESIVWKCNGHLDQQWYLKILTTYQGVTFFHIVNVNSGLCLTPTGAPGLGSGMFQGACNNTFSYSNPTLWQRAQAAQFPNLFWVFNTAGGYRMGTVMCLGVNGGNVYSGAAPILWYCNGNSDQAWYMGLFST